MNHPNIKQLHTLKVVKIDSQREGHFQKDIILSMLGIHNILRFIKWKNT